MADSILAQMIASIESEFHEKRLEELATHLTSQEKNFLSAMSEVQKIKDFIGSPENILGSKTTKHGEIAEQVQVSISNARNLIEKGFRVAEMSPNRTGPTDYIQSGEEIQSKFINGITGNNSLNDVIEHMKEYAEYKTSGHAYHIPKDQFDVIQKIMSGENPYGFNDKSTNAVLEKVRNIEEQTGRSFNDVVRPSVSEYGEVQHGRIGGTIVKHEKDLTARNETKKSEINHEHGPSFGEAVKVTAIGAAFGATCQAGIKIYKIYKDDGRNIFKGEFTAEDWKNIGIEGAKGGAKSGVFAAGIYTLTNFADMSAPMAGAVVNASFQVANLAMQFKAGDITKKEFVEMGMIACAESGFVALGAIAGQAIIPIPVIGPMVGSIAAKYLFTLGKDLLGDHFNLGKELDALYGETFALIKKEYEEFTKKIDEHFNNVYKLMEFSFGYQVNADISLLASAELAKRHGVSKDKIICSVEDVDNFIKNRSTKFIK